MVDVDMIDINSIIDRNDYEEVKPEKKTEEPIKPSNFISYHDSYVSYRDRLGV